jgi:hypothetical protein
MKTSKLQLRGFKRELFAGSADAGSAGIMYAAKGPRK